MTVIIFLWGHKFQNTAAYLGQIYNQHNFKLAPEIIKMGHNGSILAGKRPSVANLWPLENRRLPETFMWTFIMVNWVNLLNFSTSAINSSSDVLLS